MASAEQWSLEPLKKMGMPKTNQSRQNKLNTTQ